MGYWPRQSYSQMGEDLVIENNLNHFGLNPSKIRYLEVGTNDPCDSNNTYLFYLKGARGVLVEPDEMYWGRIETSRPHDKLIKGCVADFEDEAADFYILTAHSLNTLLKETAEDVCSPGGYENQKIESVVKKPVFNINSILAENFADAWPNIISIDTEGMDYRIMKAIDWQKYKTELVCVECNEFRNEIVHLMSSNGYRVVCDNTLNFVFMRG